MDKKEWFETWFDSDYYHVLYKNRNHIEANLFIEKLVHLLNLPKKSKVLDLACGKGRHSIVLNDHNLNVTGVDLSKNSIAEASKFSKEDLTFFVHDMRKVIPNTKFDAVFNLFTSFGYFNHFEDNEKVIDSIYNMLYPGGLIVIDFLNVTTVIHNLISSESKEIDGIKFEIKREVDDLFIYKKIKVIHGEKQSQFEEKVQALKLNDFWALFKNKFTILHTLGNYNLDAFDENNSSRLIIIGKKID